jgi:hypothetical protein
LYLYFIQWFHYVAEAGPKILGSRNSPESASQVARITVAHHCSQLRVHIVINNYELPLSSFLIKWNSILMVRCSRHIRFSVNDNFLNFSNTLVMAHDVMKKVMRLFFHIKVRRRHWIERRNVQVAVGLTK